MGLELPDAKVVRSRIEQADDPELQAMLKITYLCAGRVSEIVSLSRPGEMVYGIRGEDFADSEYLEEDKDGNVVARHPVAVLNIKTAKRKGTERQIAIPYKYEPWAKDIAKFLRGRRGPVFNFDRKHALYRVMRDDVFDGLTYPIETYTLFPVKGKPEISKVVSEHTKPFRLHALRHIRASELVEKYRFDAWQLAYYGGWTTRGMLGLGVGSGAFQRYVQLKWSFYVQKLLR